MPATIRLRRTGTKKKPSYRIVVTDSRFPRDGRFIEILGHYNPRSHPSTLVVKDERAKYWLKVGALPSDKVAKLLAVKGLCEPPPYRMSSTHKPEKSPPETAEKSTPEAQQDPQPPSSEKSEPAAKEEPVQVAEAQVNPEEDNV